MFKNALVFRIENWQRPSLAEFETQLDAGRFVECGASQPESVGWVAPRGDKHAALAESIGGQIILKLCTEKKAVPGSVVKLQVEEQLAQIEAQTGRRPKGKAVREMKEQIVHTLLPRAFPKRSDTLVWIDAKANQVVVGTSTMKKADAVLTRLVELLGGDLKLQPMHTALAPATAMAEWLREKEAPPGFTLDRECELKQPDLDKPSVRYTRHALDIDEVAEHIGQGKLPTQLALTWRSRVSFVLLETGALKKIKLLDVVLENKDSDTGKGDDNFDADVALATGELAKLIPELEAALGGPASLVAADPPAAGAASTPSPASPAAEDSAPWDDVKA
jgi:recombination associated protein RdgC